MVPGKVSPLSTTRPGRHQHSLARAIHMYAINVGYHLWGAHWTSKRIHFYGDNQGVVEVINSRRSNVNGLGKGPYTLHPEA